MQAGITSATVRIVTIGAGRLAFYNRVTRGQVTFGANLCMTSEALFISLDFCSFQVLLLMTVVATVAA